ncbi:MAG: Gfo/Idh/MocA family oxidoreductase [Candidatus Sumerlaeota bacterium]|nr:Gfo/Idh/MocA family oxidoreductase [Candidatus Sumerlaeota bacterium]
MKMDSKNQISRRNFIGGSLGAGAALTPLFHIVPRSVLGGPGETPPSEKLRIACIGCGGKGAGDVKAVSGEALIAFCDVDDARAAKTYKAFPDVKRYKDFREMLDKEDKNIDAVTVTVPDHMHAPIAMRAMAMGKHVFVQKPMAHTVEEAGQMRDLARKNKLATVMGIQGHASEGIRLCREWIEAGAIGKVHEVQYWTNRPIWPQGLDRPEPQPVPETLDWDVWLGAAPERPYNEAYLPFKWRGWFDFGCGALGDIGCHIMDAAFWSLNLGQPTSIALDGMSEAHEETFPKWSILTYQFPARGDMPPVTVKWFDGGKQPPRPKELEEGRQMGDSKSGQFIIGEQGIIMADMYCKSPRIIPEAKMKEFLATPPEKKYPRVKSHYDEWIKACKGGEPAGANFDYSAPLTMMVLLGNLAIRTKKNIDWDAKTQKATNVPEANQFLKIDYRKGFAL